MVTGWIIQNKLNSYLFWSEKNGWVKEKPDCFSDWQKRKIELPMYGVWVEVIIQGE